MHSDVTTSLPAFSSKVMLIQGEPAVNKVMATLLQTTQSPQVSILVNSRSELLAGLLRRDGYDVCLLAPTDHNVLETALATHPDILMLDRAVLELVLQELRSDMNEQIKRASEKTLELRELERRAEQEEQRAAGLAQRNTELETALSRARRIIHTIGEIARRTLASERSKSSEHPRAAGAGSHTTGG